MRFVKEAIVSDYSFPHINIPNGSHNMLQLNGTARPSLALENLRELEDQKLNGPDRNKMEEAMSGALASMYSG
jgi:hypothetical protein